MEKLSAIEKDLLLLFLQHHMSMETRRIVMETLPLVYNKWIGSDVMGISLRVQVERTLADHAEKR